MRELSKRLDYAYSLYSICGSSTRLTGPHQTVCYRKECDAGEFTNGCDVSKNSSFLYNSVVETIDCDPISCVSPLTECSCLSVDGNRQVENLGETTSRQISSFVAQISDMEHKASETNKQFTSAEESNDVLDEHLQHMKCTFRLHRTYCQMQVYILKLTRYVACSG